MHEHELITNNHSVRARKAMANTDPPRSLVFTSAGLKSKHRTWIGPHVDDYRLAVIHYEWSAGAVPRDQSHGLALECYRPGTKMENFLWMYSHHRSVVESQDYILLLDDDIEVTPESLSEFFSVVRQFDLWAAQLAYTSDSHLRWPITRAVPGALLRFTNFVEVGVLLVSTRVLPRLVPVFERSRSGWGVDLLLSQVLGHPQDRIAIVDRTTCRHPHRAQSEMDRVMSRSEMKAEGLLLLASYGVQNLPEPRVFRCVPLDSPLGPKGRKD